jgi:hypothetical protein
MIMNENNIAARIAKKAIDDFNNHPRKHSIAMKLEQFGVSLTMDGDDMILFNSKSYNGIILEKGKEVETLSVFISNYLKAASEIN